MNHPFNHIALGGTFDRLHLGHKRLIDLAFKKAARVSIGISTQRLLKHKSLYQIIQPYQTRKNYLIRYLKNKGFFQAASFHPLYDIYGTTKNDKTLEAIIVSPETLPNAYKINLERKKRKLPLLKILSFPFVTGKDNRTITSARIRQGEIDREGNPYLSIFNLKKQLILPQTLRPRLRNPLGKIIKEESYKKTAEKLIQYIRPLHPTLIVSVGDIITYSLINAGLVPDIQIIDFKTRRKKIALDLPLYPWAKKSINNPGTINRRTANLINQAIKTFLDLGKKQQLIISGEEDLTALPTILLAPLRSIILYGQMGLGAIAVLVTEEKKKQIKKILACFT